MTRVAGVVTFDHLPHPGQGSAARLVGFAGVLPLYGAAHIVVDASCAAAAFRIASVNGMESETFVSMLVLYHAFAFGLQPLFGLAVDTTSSPRLAAVLGCLVSALSLLLTSIPLLAIVVAGIGNAVFHVGGGSISMRLTPHRAAAPGLFVAPGSLGLLLGMVLGMSGPSVIAPLVPIAAVLCMLMIRTRIPGAVPVTRSELPLSGPELAVAFVLLSITIRSLLGFLVAFPWESQPAELILLTTATVAGKGLGGILADRLGWIRVGVGSMVAAMPLLALAPIYPLAAIPGLLLLNLTMAVTLVAVTEAIPGYPAFSFGLTCLALLLGALPSLLGMQVGGAVFVLFIMFVSSAALYRGLRALSCGCSLSRIQVRQ